MEILPEILLLKVALIQGRNKVDFTKENLFVNVNLRKLEAGLK